MGCTRTLSGAYGGQSAVAAVLVLAVPEFCLRNMIRTGTDPSLNGIEFGNFTTGYSDFGMTTAGSPCQRSECTSYLYLTSESDVKSRIA